MSGALTRLLAYALVLAGAAASFAWWQGSPWAGLTLFLIAWAALVMRPGGGP